MKQPSVFLLGLYERCLVGSVVACTVTLRELEPLAVNDFHDVRARRLFSLVSEVAEDAPLEYPVAFDVVTEFIKTQDHADAIQGYLSEAYADFVSKPTALAYAKVIADQSAARRSRMAMAALIAQR